MWKWGLMICLILGAAFAILPDQSEEHTSDSEMGITAKQELNIKHKILSRDQEITDHLCRTECLRNYKAAVSTLEQHSKEEADLYINKLLMKHPQWKELHWVSLKNQEDTVLKFTNTSDAVQRHVHIGLQKLQKGERYQSPKLTDSKHKNPQFVLAVPAKDGDKGLIGLVDQKILNQVEIAQKKNLRVVPYPSDARPRISSIDSDTYQNVDVDHPEENEDTSHYFKNQVVVKFSDEPTKQELAHIRQDISAIKSEKLGYTYVFQSKVMTSNELIEYFDTLNVEYVEPHFLYMTNETEVSFKPNDPLYSEYQWNLPIIETEEGWDITQGSTEQIVAVIDTGVDLDHPDLQNHLIKGYNFVSDHENADDDVGHGSHVAGVISASVNNAEGVAGMTWYNRIMPVKVLDSTGAGSTYSVAQGIIWATDHGATVINLSLGNYAEAEFLHDAIKYAYDQDVVLVAATGNDNTASPGYPAAYPEVLAVSATDANKARAVFSNYGSYIDVVAPGENIASTYMDKQYAALSGTSMASPHVAALAGMIRSVNPLLKNTEVLEIIRQTTTDLGQQGRDEQFGYGQINVNLALQAAMNTSYSISYWSDWIEHELERSLKG